MKTVNVPTIIMGEMKMAYAPATQGKQKKVKSFLIFTSDTPIKEGTPLSETGAAPLTALHFKTKQSINKLIDMLTHFRDNEWNKTMEDIYER